MKHLLLPLFALALLQAGCSSTTTPTTSAATTAPASPAATVSTAATPASASPVASTPSAASKDGWQTTTDDFGFSVAFPGAPDKEDGKNDNGEVGRDYTFKDASGKAVFHVSAVEIKDEVSDKEVWLNSWDDKTSPKSWGERVSTVADTVDNIPVVDAIFKNDNSHYHRRAYFVGPALVTVIVQTKGSEEDPKGKRFHDSFKVSAPQ